MYTDRCASYTHTLRTHRNKREERKEQNSPPPNLASLQDFGLPSEMNCLLLRLAKPTVTLTSIVSKLLLWPFLLTPPPPPNPPESWAARLSWLQAVIKERMAALKEEQIFRREGLWALQVGVSASCCSWVAYAEACPSSSALTSDVCDPSLLWLCALFNLIYNNRWKHGWQLASLVWEAFRISVTELKRGEAASTRYSQPRAWEVILKAFTY